MTETWTTVDEDKPETFPPNGMAVWIIYEDADGNETEDRGFWDGYIWRIYIWNLREFTSCSTVIKWRKMPHPSRLCPECETLNIVESNNWYSLTQIWAHCNAYHANKERWFPNGGFYE